MRTLVLTLLIATFLAGCTGSPETEPFEATCPSWVQGPGAPGAQVASSRYISQNDGQLKEFNLEGEFIHHPPTGTYELHGGTLDFVQFNLHAKDKNGQGTMFALDGHYTLRAYRTDMDTNPRIQDDETPNGHTDADRGQALFFRDLSKPAGQQYTSTIEIRPNEDNEWQNKTYRIEFAAADQPVRPSSLWIEYVFHADADNDDTTESHGAWKSTVTFWYRHAC